MISIHNLFAFLIKWSRHKQATLSVQNILAKRVNRMGHSFIYNSALDKLLGQLGIYAIWLSSIVYLQKQLRIFISFTPRFFLL